MTLLLCTPMYCCVTCKSQKSNNLKIIGLKIRQMFPLNGQTNRRNYMLILSFVMAVNSILHIRPSSMWFIFFPPITVSYTFGTFIDKIVTISSRLSASCTPSLAGSSQALVMGADSKTVIALDSNDHIRVSYLQVPPGSIP